MNNDHIKRGRLGGMGLAAATMLALSASVHTTMHEPKWPAPRPRPKKNSTEIERWNAEVDRRKAEKKAPK